jgi:hypothetical protein
MSSIKDTAANYDRFLYKNKVEPLALYKTAYSSKADYEDAVKNGIKVVGYVDGIGPVIGKPNNDPSSYSVIDLDDNGEQDNFISITKNIHENFSDYDLYKVLDENGYEPTKKNLAILKEGLSNNSYILTENLNIVSRSVNIMLWGKQYSLPIKYDKFDGEEITKEQIKAANAISSNSDWEKYVENGIDNYCKKNNNNEKHAKPEYVYIKRTKTGVKAAIMFSSNCEPEHGLTAIIYPNKTPEIGIQDIIL